MTTVPPQETESMTYKILLNQVENLTREISQPDLDLDELVAKVEQGYRVIAQMKERLEQTKLKIEELNDHYDSSSSPDNKS